MSNNFRIYSTDITPTVDPDSAIPAPATLIAFGEDPDAADYSPSSSNPDRGSVWDTFGGKVYQDFGVLDVDETITFSGSVVLTQAVVTALKSAYETLDTEWYFTDGYNCWKVRFSRDPKGFRYWRDIFFAAKGKTYFSYEIQLLVVSEEI